MVLHILHFKYTYDFMTSSAFIKSKKTMYSLSVLLARL